MESSKHFIITYYFITDVAVQVGVVELPHVVDVDEADEAEYMK